MLDRLAGAVAKKPFGVSGKRIGKVVSRIEARNNADFGMARGTQEVAEEIALAEPGRHMLKGNYGGIEGDDAARAGNEPVNLQAAPIIDPFIDVESRGVLFIDIDLPEAPDAIVPIDLLPRRRCFIGAQRGGQRESGGKGSAGDAV